MRATMRGCIDCCIKNPARGLGALPLADASDLDRALQADVLGVGRRRVTALHGRLEVPEVGTDRRGVVAVLQALALRAQDSLLL